MQDTKDTKKKMLEELEYNLGIVSTSCMNAGISRATHYRWLKEDQEYKKDYESINETAIDIVESKLFEKIKDKDTTAIIFYLKTKAKHRGFVERQELALPETKEFTVKVLDNE